MVSRQEIAEVLKARLASVKERGRAMAQILKARADIAATRRRLRRVFAELGEEAFNRLEAGKELTPGDAGVDPLLVRIRGLQAELAQQEVVLQQIIQDGRCPACGGKGAASGAST
jgi:hypothetical protein